jgi:peptidoglycan/LPS O-acetylase OafA/YrhL
MRALAVMAVVIYHLWPHRLAGGFMGVDIFFVISGYLMTLSILKGVDKVKKEKKHRFKHSVSFLFAFYAKRIKRLAPAATVLLLAVLLAVFALGKLSVEQETSTQVIRSSLFVQNWYLADQAVDYLAHTKDATAVQHFWSLSVEEQFYMIWPLLLLVSGLLGWAIYKRAKRRFLKWGGRNLVFAAMTLFTAAAFIYGYFLTKSNPAAAYFVTPARIWELSLGGLIVFLPKIKHKDLQLLLPWLGVAMCLYSMFKLDAAGFPGWHALIPTIGAALIIYGASDSKYSVNRLSRFRPIQFLGDTSYSLYLWHWPLIILVPLFLGIDLQPTEVSYLWLKSLVLVASLVLAWLSYRFVETPARKLKLSTVRSWVLGVTCLILVLLPAQMIGSYASDYLKTGLAKMHNKALDDSEHCFGAKATLNTALCGNPYGKINTIYAQLSYQDLYETLIADYGWCRRTNIAFECELGDLKSDKKVLAIGNSHNQQLANAYNYMSKRLHIRISLITYYPWKNMRDNSADYNHEKVREKILRDIPKYDGVIFSHLENSWSFPQDGVDDFKEVLKVVRDNGKKVIYIQDVPYSGIGGGQLCLNHNLGCKTDKDYEGRDFLLRTLLRDKSIGRNEVIYTDKLFCDNKYCYSHIGGVPVYFNNDDVGNSHITATYSATMGEFFVKELRDRLSK